MNKETPCIVAQRMRDRRKALSKTQGKLSQDTGLSLKTINSLEKMTAPTLSVDTFMRLCTALDCSADYLLGIDELPHHETTDIHAATGLSESAIEELMSCKKFSETMKKKGYSFRTYEEEVPQFISFLLTAMNGHLFHKHIEIGARARILAKRYEEKEPEFEEMIQVIRQREEFLNDMLNDEKWDTVDITIPSEQNLIFRKTFCENTESANRSKIHSMLTDIYDVYADRRIDEECVMLENEERMV